MDTGEAKAFLARKLGPLPTWAWMLIGLGAAVTFSVIRNNRASAKAKADETPDSETDSSTGVDLIGGNQNPPVVFQNYSTSIFTPPNGGRTTPPTAPPPVTTPPATVPPPATTPPATSTTPVTTPPVTKPVATKPAPPAPKGQWVTVAKWTAKNPPWNSTLWGIANHVYHNGNKWAQVWNAPQNAALKARRKKPEGIQAGDKIWVPA